MPVPKKRWGLSALSKENKQHAYKEELMVDKQTGEMLIKTKQGDIMSYSILNRFKSHVDEVTAVAQSRNLYGDMYKLELTNPYPIVLGASDMNICSTPQQVNGNFSRILISLDLDVVSTKVGEISKDKFDPNINFSYVQTMSDGTTSPQVNISNVALSEFNQRVYTIQKKIGAATSVGISIKKLEIDTSNLSGANVYRLILNNVIIVTE